MPRRPGRRPAGPAVRGRRSRTKTPPRGRPALRPRSRRPRIAAASRAVAPPFPRAPAPGARRAASWLQLRQEAGDVLSGRIRQVPASPGEDEGRYSRLLELPPGSHHVPGERFVLLEQPQDDGIHAELTGDPDDRGAAVPEPARPRRMLVDVPRDPPCGRLVTVLDRRAKAGKVTR